MTIGNLIDTLSILEKRISVVENEQHDTEIINNLLTQRGWVIKEIAKLLTEIKNYDRPAQFKKHKLYNSDINLKENSSLLKTIELLNEFNHALWNLEDRRRDKTLTDKERLDAADEVAKFNKLRNDAIDNIDKIIDEAMQHSLYYQG